MLDAIEIPNDADVRKRKRPVLVERLDSEHERIANDVRQFPISLSASLLLVQSMLHLGAECACDPDRQLILLAIADIGDGSGALVDAAVSEQTGIVARRIGGGALDGNRQAVLGDGEIRLRLAAI